MKSKSLRQLAREIGGSHSYLSQVKYGKRPVGEKVVIKMVSSGKRRMFDVRVENDYNSSRWQRSSGVEQRTHKPLVGGSNPPAATFSFYDSISGEGVDLAGEKKCYSQN
jgi:hypothetical protein